MARRWLLPLIWGLFFLTVLVNLFAWGGVAYTPKVGPVIEAHANREAFLTATYLSAGRRLVGFAGVENSARNFAGARLGSAYAGVEASPATAVQQLQDAMPAALRLSHRASPWLLLLAAALSLFLPKPVQLIKTRR